MSFGKDDLFDPEDWPLYLLSRTARERDGDFLLPQEPILSYTWESERERERVCVCVRVRTRIKRQRATPLKLSQCLLSCSIRRRPPRRKTRPLSFQEISAKISKSSNPYSTNASPWFLKLSSFHPSTILHSLSLSADEKMKSVEEKIFEDGYWNHASWNTWAKVELKLVCHQLLFDKIRISSWEEPTLATWCVEALRCTAEYEEA